MEGPQSRQRSARIAITLLFACLFCFGVRFAVSEEIRTTAANTQILPNDAPPAIQTAQSAEVIHAKSSAEHQARVVRNTDSVKQYAVDQAHAKCYENDPFPSAKKCKECHPKHYREWSVSPHAYAQLSPVFNAMSNKLIKMNNGTLGDFCIRCHTPTGMALNEPINISNLCRNPTSREGVTCVTCHRINQAWGKGAGRQALVHGDVHSPIYGSIGSGVLNQVLANPDHYGVLKTHPDSTSRGRDIHKKSYRFFQLTTSGFCGTCHDVFAPNGFRLEDAFSEYKSSPAAKQDCVSCQDCHMGKVPGKACGYWFEPVAKVGNVETPPRKRTNHMMAGPDYSIVHPGLFPHNPEAIRERGDTSLTAGLATMEEWLQFRHRSGWGTKNFEESLPKNYHFPSAWNDSTRRIKARKILNDQQELLAESARQRHQILRTGYQLGNFEIKKADCKHGLKFSIPVCNGTNGHGVPTGFDAERVVFLRVMIWNRHGKLVYQSGDLDPNGDLRDDHSFYVHNGKIPRDRQLFTLQSRFITRNLRGGEREQVLNVPFSLDPLPYIRPETRPFTVLGRPIGARKHKQNIEIEGTRDANYHVSAKQLCGSGPYTIRVQLIAGMVPVNLVHEISDVGFDYGMSAREVAWEVVRGHMVLHERTTRVRLEQ